jgi:hypothetical protein
MKRSGFKLIEDAPIRVGATRGKTNLDKNGGKQGILGTKQSDYEPKVHSRAVWKENDQMVEKREGNVRLRNHRK